MPCFQAVPRFELGGGSPAEMLTVYMICICCDLDIRDRNIIAVDRAGTPRIGRAVLPVTVAVD